jgi:hypothetical protein
MKIGLVLFLCFLFILTSCGPSAGEVDLERGSTVTEADEEYEYHYEVGEEERTKGSGKKPTTSGSSENTAPVKITYSQLVEETSELLADYVAAAIGPGKYTLRLSVQDDQEIYDSAEVYLRDPDNYPLIYITTSISDPFYVASVLQTRLREAGYYATVYIDSQ